MRHFLKDILKEQHLTHEVAASRCQVSRAYLTQIINGERRPSPPVAKRIDWSLDYARVLAWMSSRPCSTRRRAWTIS